MTIISPHISPKELSLIDKLRRWDFHPKIKEDFRVRTVHGGIASIVALLAMAYLFVSELSYSMEKEIVDHMYVNSTRDTRLLFNFNMTFPKLSCSLLSADALDPLGNKQEGVDQNNVFKTRLDKDGNPLSDKTKHELGDTFTSVESFKEHHGITDDKEKEGADEPSTEEKKCGNCYGAGDPGQCCNTCVEVKAAYKKKGWAFINLNVEQCNGDASRNSALDEAEEGCNIHGSLLLTQESGNVHIAPGEQLRHSGSLNVADLVMFTFLKFNISHEIHYLSFGDEFPGFKSPLNNEKRVVEDGYGMYQYYLKVVPTVYRFLESEKAPVHSNQYAVTEHLRHVNPGSNRGLPGVWFFYDMSPVHVEFQERRQGFLRFLVSVCAIVGGIFSVMGVLDNLIHNFFGKPRHTKRAAAGS